MFDLFEFAGVIEVKFWVVFIVVALRALQKDDAELSRAGIFVIHVIQSGAMTHFTTDICQESGFGH